MGVGLQGLSAQEQALAVTVALNQEVAQMGMRQNYVLKEFADLRRAIEARRRTAQPRGR